jgi:formyltetrahydrofolate deformylase
VHAPDPAPVPTQPVTAAPRREFVLTLSCPDRPGIVYAVASFLVQHGCNILDSHQYDDDVGDYQGTFFMRVHFSALDPVTSLERLTTGFASVAESFRMWWRLVDAHERARAVILVSRFGHCLNDLLFRQRIGALPEQQVVEATHFADRGAPPGTPVPPRPAPRPTTAAAAPELVTIVERERADLVILARYMQVLSPELCERLEGRAINIHHSFLPSFKGARPYGQAHDRGVKLIGATAHYVTANLDEGPIIEQEVARIDHTYTVDQMAAVGRDVECQVLARAVTWHAESRVLLNGHRTVVFR